MLEARFSDICCLPGLYLNQHEGYVRAMAQETKLTLSL